jgi:hypothetical protein
MDEEFEFHFNIYDESNVNRPRAEWPHGDNAMCKGVDRRRTCDENAHGLASPTICQNDLITSVEATERA